MKIRLSYKIFYLVSSLTLTLFYIFNKFIRERIFINLNEEVSTFFYIITFISFILNLYALKLLFIPRTPRKSKNQLIHYLRVFLAHLHVSFIYLHDYLEEKFNSFFIAIRSKIIVHWVYMDRKLKYNKEILVIIFVILPKLIIAICILIDVFIFNHLFLIKKVVIILFIPLLFKIVLYSCNKLCELGRFEALQVFEYTTAKGIPPGEVEEQLCDILTVKVSKACLEKSDISRADLRRMADNYMYVFAPGHIFLYETYEIIDKYLYYVNIAFYTSFIITSAKILYDHAYVLHNLIYCFVSLVIFN